MNDMRMPRQQEMFNLIKYFIEMNKYSPTVRELALLMDLKSLSTAHAHLEKLRDKNLITWNPKQPRTIRLVEGATYYDGRQRQC